MRADVPFLLIVSGWSPSYLIYVVVWGKIQLVTAYHIPIISIDQVSFFLNIAELLFRVKLMPFLVSKWVKFGKGLRLVHDFFCFIPIWIDLGFRWNLHVFRDYPPVHPNIISEFLKFFLFFLCLLLFQNFILYSLSYHLFNLFKSGFTLTFIIVWITFFLKFMLQRLFLLFIIHFRI